MNKKQFLNKEVLPLLQGLKTDTLPKFGLMTPQHMIEHLTMITKVSIKSHGNPPAEPTKGQLGFKKFIANGAIMSHRPSDKTKADLPELKYDNLKEAIAQVPAAIDRFYEHFSNDKDLQSYHPMMGQLGFEELELFHYQHYRYHFFQFGLLEKYP